MLKEGIGLKFPRRKQKIIKGKHPDPLGAKLFGEGYIAPTTILGMKLYRAHLHVYCADDFVRYFLWIFRAKSDMDAAKKVERKMKKMNQDKKVWIENPLPRHEFEFSEVNCEGLDRIVRKLGLYMWGDQLSRDGEVMFMQ